MKITLSTTSFHVIASILHYDIKLVVFLPTSNHSMLLTVLTEVKVRSETSYICVSGQPSCPQARYRRYGLKRVRGEMKV